MAYLKETNAAFSDMAANSELHYGLHLAGEVRTGRQGLPMGEVMFDPGRHSVASINHRSLMADTVGVPYVRQVLPTQPLSVTVVVEHRPNPADHPGIEGAKQILAKTLRESLIESKGSATDWIHTYLLGDLEETITDFDVIDRKPKTNAAVIRTMADICSSGLGIVISDFERVDFSAVKRNQFAGTVALKINHQYEVSLPSNRGIWNTGNGNEVDTRCAKQLRRYNDISRSRHHHTMDQLARAGFSAAAIELNPDLYERGDHRKLGVSVEDLDTTIAKAIRATVQ
ncbi:MAG TPA: hypothetical protein VFN56_00970 [Candidatus Saccharimonadales bacterium]|nr:hypothetical protein [Candidatus Saccharimonadales bacterium]